MALSSGYRPGPSNFGSGYPPVVNQTAPHQLAAAPSPEGVHAGNWREVLLERETQMAGLVEEYTNIEGDMRELKENHAKDLQASRNREALLVTACDKLLSYTCRVEQQILIPAVGSVSAAFGQFHEVAQARAQGIQSAEAVVNAANYPRLAALFSSLRAPSRSVAANNMKKYQQQMQSINLDEAYNLAVTGAQESGALLDLLSQTAVSLGGLSSQPMSPSPNPPRNQPEPASPGTQGRIADLQAEVERLRANQLSQGSSPNRSYGGDNLSQQLAGVRAEKKILEDQLAAARNEIGLMHQRTDAQGQQLKAAQDDNMQLQHRVQLQAAGAHDQVVVQLQTENDRQRRHIYEQEQQIQANEEERKAVAVSFTSIKQALEQQQANNNVTANNSQSLEMEKMIKQLEQDNHSLQQDLDETHNRMKDANTRNEDKVRRLTKEKLVLQQEVAAQAAAKDSGVDAFLSDVHRSQNAGDSTLGTINNLVQDTMQAQQYQTKIKAFEMTISALNAELAHLEDNVLDTQRHQEVEKTQLHEEFENERGRLLTEAKELDLVVERMNNELERVLTENEELRSRLRSSSAGGLRPVPLPAGSYKAPPPPPGPVAIPVRH